MFVRLLFYSINVGHATLLHSKHKNEDDIEEADDKIADLIAEKNVRLITEHFDQLSGSSGAFSLPKMWNLKKRIFPKNKEVPMAMKDSNGNLIRGKIGLKQLYKDTYIDRLSEKTISAGWEDIKEKKEELFSLRLKKSSMIKSKDWTLQDIRSVCKNLKNGKARDQDDYNYELFKPSLAGLDLTKTLMLMFSSIKRELFVPDFFQKMTITSLHKNKGSKSDFKNQRGIFNVSKIRSIFDKVMYGDIYDILDEEISCSNIGGRRGRNIRDHLFVLYGMINDVMKGNAAPIDVQTLDIYKCFDEMWYSKTHNDIYDAKVTDDKFAMLAKLDEKAIVKVKTPCGETDQFNLEKIIIQGGVFSPIKCTVQIDTLGRDCMKYNECLYKYKNAVNVPPLALIDDVVAVTKSGIDTIQMNAKINMKMESKKLRLSADKCKHLHISKKKSECLINLKVHNGEMMKADNCAYLETFPNRIVKGHLSGKVSLKKTLKRIILILR